MWFMVRHFLWNCRFYSSRKFNSWLFYPHMVIMMCWAGFVNNLSAYEPMKGYINT
jgi:hypothetical protein